MPTPKLAASSGGSFSDLEPISPSDVWGVGRRLSGSSHRTLAEHWDGASWTVVPTPNASVGDNGLNAVSAASPNDAWAAGYAVRANSLRTLTQHWNGSSWTVVSSADRGTDANELVGVASVASDDVWAVGSARSSGVYRTLAEHWNGTAWNVVPTPDVGRGDGALLGVSAVSSTNVWAAGYSTTLGVHATLVEHWNGASWTVVGTPNLGAGTGSAFTDISGSPRDGLWAVGYSSGGIVYRTLAERWNGVAWSVKQTPNRGTNVSIFRGVAALSSTDAWAAGTSYDDESGKYATLTEHWNGSAWSTVPSPPGGSPPRASSELSSVVNVPSSSQVWAAGVTGAQVLVLTLCGSASSPASGVGEVGRSPGSPAPARARSLGRMTAGSPVREPTPPSGVAAGEAAEAVTASDVASAAGIAEVTKTWSAAVGDFNADGQTDFLLGRHQLPARLYINAGGQFTEVDVGTFRHEDRHDCAASDVNGDGRLDLFCSVGAGRGTRLKSDDLQIQQPSLAFHEAAPASGLMDPLGRGRHIAFLDANGDGHPDLFAGNEGVRADGLPAPNRLFVNNGDGTFHAAPHYGLDHQIGSKCAQSADFNSDGWEDLLLCAEAPSGIRLYRNDGGRGFTNVTGTVGIAGSQPADAELADLNRDGRPDLVEVLNSRLVVFLQTSGGTFQAAFTYPLTSGTSVASGDVNGDGAPDLYVLQGGSQAPNDPDVMLLNGGGGKSFTRMAIPQTSRGTGDRVYPIDHDGNGLTDFLVLNGRNQSVPGPIQLIAFFSPAGSAQGMNAATASEATERPTE